MSPTDARFATGTFSARRTLPHPTHETSRPIGDPAATGREQSTGSRSSGPHRQHSVLARDTGSTLTCHSRIAERETPASLLTEFGLRPWSTRARTRLRVAMSYMSAGRLPVSVCPRNGWAEAGVQYFGPTCASMSATDAFFATEMLNGSPYFRVIFHSMLTAVRVSEQMRKMSSDLLVKK